jgi:hypothetical protein
LPDPGDFEEQEAPATKAGLVGAWKRQALHFDDEGHVVPTTEAALVVVGVLAVLQIAFALYPKPFD